MAASYGGGGGGSSSSGGSKSSNSTYIVQKASGSTYGPATSAINGNASKHSSIQYGNKFTSMKVNSHLLDHGYGATPQSSSYDNNAVSTRLSSQDDASQFKGYTNSFDAGITKYYKVSSGGSLFLHSFHLNLILQSHKHKRTRCCSNSISSSSREMEHPSMYLFIAFATATAAQSKRNVALKFLIWEMYFDRQRSVVWIWHRHHWIWHRLQPNKPDTHQPKLRVQRLLRSRRQRKNATQRAHGKDKSSIYKIYHILCVHKYTRYIQSYTYFIDYGMECGYTSYIFHMKNLLRLCVA